MWKKNNKNLRIEKQNKARRQINKKWTGKSRKKAVKQARAREKVIGKGKKERVLGEGRNGGSELTIELVFLSTQHDLFFWMNFFYK